MVRTIRNLLEDLDGASAAEYAMILAIIGSVLALGAVALGHAVAKTMDDSARCVEAPEGGC